MKKRIGDWIRNRVAQGPLHFGLIDPADAEKPGIISRCLDNCINSKTDAVLLGGSSHFDQKDIDSCIELIRKNYDVPIILFPGNLSSVARGADALLFMTLLNSQTPYWISGAQALAAPLVRRNRLEALATAYLIVEPGGSAGFVGDAKLFPRSKPELAAAYAMAAEYLGMSFVYLEAGSGSAEPVPEELVACVRKSVSIPIIVGGGIRRREQAASLVAAGADILVTGNSLSEKDGTSVASLVAEGIRDSGLR